MIKYLRDKITGRPVDFSSFDENLPPIKKTHSQNSLNDDQPISQVEKLSVAAGGHRLINSSSPIIIPKKLTCSNPSSHSSSSYTSIADQMSSLGETLFQSYRETDDASTSLPMLPSTCQKLEHTAARDRILVKNKRRQPIKEKLNTLKETNDNQINLFVSTTPDNEEDIVESTIETTVPIQQTVNLVDLDTGRSRLRIPVRPRDHSADNILSTIPIVPTYISSMQRSISFKRPQEMNERKFSHRSIYKIEKDDDNEEEQEDHRKRTQEHIYDNLDVFKQNKNNIKSDLVCNNYDSTINHIVKTREQSMPSTGRLRPLTMHIPPSTDDKQTTNEFENVFNQLKKRAPIKQVQAKEEIIPISTEKPVQSDLSSITIEETSKNLVTTNEPIVPPALVSTNKVVVTSSLLQAPNRRKTVGGVYLPGNNKVAVDDNKPTPSWIDIAKQKQNKFQHVANEKDSHEDLEQQTTTPTTSIEPVIVSKTQVNISSNTAIIKENTSEDIRSNRKSMYEPILTRRTSPPITTPQVIQRDSIRALKAGNPNRINNLIQFFDK